MRFLTVLLRSFLCTLAFVLTAQAESSTPKVLLFIDLDDAPLEVSAAQEIAARNGEEFHSIPDLTNQTRKQLGLEHDNLDKLNTRLNRANESESSTLKPQQETARTAFEDDMKLLGFSKERLAEKFRQLVASGKEVQTIIISGHSDGCFITGDFGNFNRSDMRLALADAKPVALQVKNLAIAGCYGNTIYNGQKWWNLFPNLELLAGWDDPAPARTDRASPDFLRSFLNSRSRFTTASSLQDAISSYNLVRVSVPKSTSVRTKKFFVSHHNALSTDDIQTSCSEEKRLKLLELVKTYRGYLTASEKGFEDVPSNTSSGAMRNLYTELQHYSHCSFTFPEGSKIEDQTYPYAKELSAELNARPNRARIIELILYKNVVKNYGLYYAFELRHMTDLLKKLGAPVASTLPNFRQGSERSQTLNYYRELDQFMKSCPKNNSDCMELFGFQNSLKNLTTLNCIPFSWVEQSLAKSTMQPPEYCTSFQGGFADCDAEPVKAVTQNPQHPTKPITPAQQKKAETWREYGRKILIQAIEQFSSKPR